MFYHTFLNSLTDISTTTVVRLLDLPGETSPTERSAWSPNSPQSVTLIHAARLTWGNSDALFPWTSMENVETFRVLNLQIKVLTTNGDLQKAHGVTIFRNLTQGSKCPNGSTSVWYEKFQWKCTPRLHRSSLQNADYWAHVSFLTGSGDVVGGDNWLECHKRAAVKYKFFLAFEDAVCKDYVTEKLFSMFNGGIDMIPIVLGTNHSS